MIQQRSTEQANRNRDQLHLQETVSNLQQSLQSEQQAAEGAVSTMSQWILWTFASFVLR